MQPNHKKRPGRPVIIPHSKQVIYSPMVCAKIDFLDKHMKHQQEWYAVQFYDRLDGTPITPENALDNVPLIIQDIMPVYQGSPGYCSFEAKNVEREIARGYRGPGMYWGMMHSHHSMQAYASGTDQSDLIVTGQEIPTGYLSSIVSYAGHDWKSFVCLPVSEEIRQAFEAVPGTEPIIPIYQLEVVKEHETPLLKAQVKMCLENEGKDWVSVPMNEAFFEGVQAQENERKPPNPDSFEEEKAVVKSTIFPSADESYSADQLLGMMISDIKDTAPDGQVEDTLRRYSQKIVAICLDKAPDEERMKKYLFHFKLLNQAWKEFRTE